MRRIGRLVRLILLTSLTWQRFIKLYIIAPFSNNSYLTRMSLKNSKIRIPASDFAPSLCMQAQSYMVCLILFFRCFFKPPAFLCVLPKRRYIRRASLQLTSYFYLSNFLSTTIAFEFIISLGMSKAFKSILRPRDFLCALRYSSIATFLLSLKSGHFQRFYKNLHIFY